MPRSRPGRGPRPNISSPPSSRSCRSPRSRAAAPRRGSHRSNLAELARTFTEIYEPSAEDRGQRIALVDATGGTATVTGEKGLLGQVLANLIENALRHTQEGCRITVRLARAAGAVVLEVADTGPGIPEAERANVLRRLYRLERSRTTPGSGLGLALVSVIAELHEAALELDDAAPGLVVRLRFPTA